MTEPSKLPPGSPAGETASEEFSTCKHGFLDCKICDAVPEPVPTEGSESLNEEQIRKRLFEIRDTIEDAPNAAVIFINQLLMANWVSPSQPSAPEAAAALKRVDEAIEKRHRLLENGVDCDVTPLYAERERILASKSAAPIAPAAEGLIQELVDGLQLVQLALADKVVNHVAPWRRMRNWLKQRDIYEGDLQEHRVTSAVVDALLARAEEYRKGAKNG
jgi:hypothetical protein